MSVSDSVDVGQPLDSGQPRGLSRGTIIPWLIVIGVAFPFLPLYLTSTGMRSETARLEAESVSVQAALSQAEIPRPDVLNLMNTLTQIEQSISEFEAMGSSLAASHADWPAIMAAIGNHDPAQLALISLSQG